MPKADVEGRTPLLVACLHGHLEVAELLVDAGATLQKAQRDVAVCSLVL